MMSLVDTDAGKARFGVLWKVLKERIEVITFCETEDGQSAWLACSPRLYCVSCGPTEAQALAAWRSAFLANVLLLADARVSMHEDAPDAEVASWRSRSDARSVTFSFALLETP